MDYKKCGSCNCYKKIDCFGCRKSGIPYKCCNKCRNPVKKTSNKEDDNNKEDEIKADEKDMGYFENKKIVKITKVLPNDLKKCFKCRGLFAPIGKAYESVEYLTCLSCKTNGNHLHLDDIDISHEIYPEK